MSKSHIEILPSRRLVWRDEKVCWVYDNGMHGCLTADDCMKINQALAAIAAVPPETTKMLRFIMQKKSPDGTWFLIDNHFFNRPEDVQHLIDEAIAMFPDSKAEYRIGQIFISQAKQYVAGE